MCQHDSKYRIDAGPSHPVRLKARSWSLRDVGKLLLTTYLSGILAIIATVLVCLTFVYNHAWPTPGDYAAPATLLLCLAASIFLASHFGWADLVDTIARENRIRQIREDANSPPSLPEPYWLATQEHLDAFAED